MCYYFAMQLWFKEKEVGVEFEKLLECSDFKVGQKIKGKYLIYDVKESGILLCQANDEKYQFKPLLKNKDIEGILSENTRILTSIKHKNIHNVEVLQDERFFYLVSKIYKQNPYQEFYSAKMEKLGLKSFLNVICKYVKH